MKTRNVVKRLLNPIVLILVASMAIEGGHLAATHLSRSSANLAVDKSLVEREQERIEADCATPEASPCATPFSLSRPMEIVSATGISLSHPTV